MQIFYCPPVFPTNGQGRYQRTLLSPKIAVYSAFTSRQEGEAFGRHYRTLRTGRGAPPSKLDDALDVSFDYLSGKTDTELDSATLGKIREISVMPEEDRKQELLVLDALIRDFKARKTYAQ